ncbi:DUF4388 domain-containing protein [Acidobacteriota bacterium]
MSHEGQLSEITLPEVIRDVYINRRTGILVLKREQIEKQILFSHGNVLYCRSNLNEEKIGEILVARDKIAADVRDKALGTKDMGRKFGTILVEMGVLTPQELVETLKEQVILIVASVLGWRDGIFSFDDSKPLETETGLNLPTANIIMDAVRRLEDYSVIAQGLDDASMTVVLSSNPLLRFQSISLRPKEGFILSRIDGFLSISEICSISPVPEEDTLRCLYGLLSAGILELQPSQIRNAANRGKKAKMDGNIAGFFFEDLAGTEEYLDERAQPQAPELLSEEEQKEVTDVESFLHRMTAMNYYEILAVDKEADFQAIRKAYYKLAKKYHPDRYRGRSRSTLQNLCETIFIKVNEAYETLSDEEARQIYNERQPAEAQQVQNEDEKEDLKKRQELLAEQSFRQGKQLFDQGDYYGAIQLFKRAWHHNQSHAHYAHYLGLSLTKNPKWQRQAEEYFLKAIELDPYNAEHYAQLGRLYKSAGLEKRAVKRFREALKWDAGNKMALDGLMEIEHGKGHGFSKTFKGLFTDIKKKK